MSYVKDITTNIDKCEIFQEDYRYKIKFLGKLSYEQDLKDSYSCVNIYLLECHGKKYILKDTNENDSLWGTIYKNISIEEVDDLFTEINKLKVRFDNIKYFVGKDKYLENKKVYSPYEIDFKEFFINADKKSSDFGIKEYEKLKEVDHIDFTVFLTANTREKNTDYVNQYFKNLPHTGAFPMPRPAFVLKDGTTISIQASTTTYCSPRVNNAEKYEAVEVGFPSKEFPELLPYAEDPETPTHTVYGYVPVEILNAIIDREGLDPDFYNKYFKAEYILEDESFKR